jgi:hypothetical protein
MSGTKTIRYIREHSPSLFGNRHGACSTSKIAGPTYGTAKNIAHTVMLILSAEPRPSDILEALIYVNEHVDRNNLRGKAVLNISLSCKFNTLV